MRRVWVVTAPLNRITAIVNFRNEIKLFTYWGDPVWAERLVYHRMKTQTCVGFLEMQNLFDKHEHSYIERKKKFNWLGSSLYRDFGASIHHRPIKTNSFTCKKSMSWRFPKTFIFFRPAPMPDQEYSRARCFVIRVCNKQYTLHRSSLLSIHLPKASKSCQNLILL